MTGDAANAGGRSGDPLLDPHWWAFGLALHERGAGSVSREVVEDVARLAKWRADYGIDSRFDERLTEAGLTAVHLGRLLGESPVSLAHRVQRPAWVSTVEEAVRKAGAAPAYLPPGAADWRECRALPLHSFVTGARDSLVERAGRFLAPGHAILADIAADFAAGLSRRLVRISARTFAHEFRMLSEPAALARLVTRYPVLGRMLGQVSRFAADAEVELLRRFADDRAAIVDTLLGGVDPGPVVAIESGLGDPHRHGRTVARLVFADESQVVYKPRDLRSHEWFSTMVRCLNRVLPEPGLLTVTALARSGYGWLEFVPDRPLENLAGADRFYTRQGVLLALLHLVQASDIHCENVIACGDQPVLVDLETVFHPTLSVSDKLTDPASAALAASVQRPGLLPAIIVGQGGVVEMSGLGGERGQVSQFGGTQNRPRLGSLELDVVDHEKALLGGFRLGYDAIMRHRREFADLIRTGAGVEVRAVVRHTRGYVSLRSVSTDPALLRDGLDRDRAFDLLWTESVQPAHRKVCQYEQADLWSHDIPLFSGRPDSVDLWTSAGRRLPGLLDRPPLDIVLDRLAALTEEDRRDQEWIISAALATQRLAGRHDSTEPMPGYLAGTAVSPELLLAMAGELADRIVARGHADGERVNWLGLELVEDRHWMVLPMGAGLANGYLGVALFLAQLAELTGVPRYAEVARRAIRNIPALCDTLAAQPDLVAAIGCGGLHGFGGMAYGLARLATLLVDDEIGRWVLAAVELAAVAADSADSPGWATGTAGCLAAMSAVHAELGPSEAADLADRSAGRLAALLADRSALKSGLPQGFADGIMGIGWALARFAATTGDASHARPARLAVSGAWSPAVAPADLPARGWCSGAAGDLVGRSVLHDPADPELATHLLTERPVLRDLSLCHGELGIADVLIALTRTGEGTAPAAHTRRAGLILDAINKYGPSCGTPAGVSTPGLLTGLAGIGYGLLRLAFPERVPSVLLLEPAATSARQS